MAEPSIVEVAVIDHPGKLDLILRIENMLVMVRTSS